MLWNKKNKTEEDAVHPAHQGAMGGGQKKLVVANPDHVFRVCNGHTLETLLDLYDELRTIGSEDFETHAHGKQNDFAVWVSDILLDIDLAEAIRRTETAEEMSYLVAQALDEYEF